MTDSLTVPAGVSEQHDTTTSQTIYLECEQVVKCGHCWREDQIRALRAGTLKIACQDCLAAFTENV